MGKIKDLGINIIQEEALANAKKAIVRDEWVNLEKLMDETTQNLSKDMREPDGNLTLCELIVRVTGDLYCDVRSGGLMGNKVISAFYGIEPKYYARAIRPNCKEWVKDFHGKPVVQVNSVVAHASQHKAKKLNTLDRNFKGRKIIPNANISDGSSGYC